MPRSGQGVESRLLFGVANLVLIIVMIVFPPTSVGLRLRLAR